ncbi:MULTISPECIES: PqqD family protein [Idiomarina]|uniref:PqqD family protein n=1 Tax=Idiomarina TaxID=135575 RepID=UPI00129C4121|nr:MULTISPECIES: PqqD family protein [Idiomarina]MRJ42959.1 PqqD family peptide modification chaperone [Idiomarina sp. FeN1]NCU58511.1 PqqD family peptide modification chaperone [Idiomarina sp. FenA--70]NCU61208.1 PqqD family peptide modification chaperone [Idiomarina sp. FenBw--71]UUN12708.1 PqqD family protein [Idiomarina loihiensis]
MVIDLESKVQRHPDLVFALMGEEVVMMSEDQDNYLGLNGVASKIWTMLEEPHVVNVLCTKLQQEFEVSKEQCEQDLLFFLNDMQQKKLIQIHPDEA